MASVAKRCNLSWAGAVLTNDSPAGTEAFNQELGRLTLLSYPIIAIPSMLMMMALLFWLARQAKTLTGLDLGDMLHG